MELNDLLSCGVWASRGQTWTPQRSRDLAAAWQFWTAHASGWVWVTGWKPGQWGRQSESFSTGGSLQNTHKHKPAMSVWWFNSKFNSIEESWTDLWRKWHGCSVKDARLKKTETETACIIKIMRKKKKKTKMVKRLLDLTLECLHQKICCRKVSGKTLSDIFSGQITHHWPWVCSSKAKAMHKQELTICSRSAHSRSSFFPVQRTQWPFHLSDQQLL